MTEDKRDERVLGALFRVRSGIDRLKVTNLANASSQERIGWQSAVRRARREVDKVIRDFT